MSMQNVTELFYEKASARIKARIKERGMTHKEIYPNDPKQISWIINNKKTKNNRFLICDAVLESYINNETYGLTEKLGFADHKEVLWGNDTEINGYLFELFNLLWEEITEDNMYGIDGNEYLCDYVYYAKYYTYWNILFSGENTYPAIMYGIYEDTVVNEKDNAKKKALEYLYVKCMSDFKDIFMKFKNNTESFHKLEKVVQNKLIISSFIPLIKKMKPDESSLGIRARNLIITDLSKSALLMADYHNTGQINKYYQMLINASSTYINILETIQDKLEDELKDKLQDELKVF